MRNIKAFLLEDWKLKVWSVVLAVLIWLWVNVSGSVPLILSKELQLINDQPHYEYKLHTKRVKIKLYIPQGARIDKLADEIRAYVDVGGLKPGEYVVPIKVETKYKLVFKIEDLDPEYAKVLIREKPQQGR